MLKGKPENRIEHCKDWKCNRKQFMIFCTRGNNIRKVFSTINIVPFTGSSRELWNKKKNWRIDTSHSTK